MTTRPAGGARRLPLRAAAGCCASPHWPPTRPLRLTALAFLQIGYGSMTLIELFTGHALF